MREMDVARPKRGGIGELHRLHSHEGFENNAKVFGARYPKGLERRFALDTPALLGHFPQL